MRASTRSVVSFIWLAFLGMPVGVYTWTLSTTGLGLSAFIAGLLSLLLITIFLQRGNAASPDFNFLVLLALALGYAGGLFYFDAWNTASRGAFLLFISLPLIYYCYRCVPLGLDLGSGMQKFADAIVVGSFITAVIGIAQYLGILGEVQAAPGPGMAGHKNHFGYVCAVGLGAALPYVNFRNRGGLLHAAASTVLVAGVLVSMSRGAWVAGGLVLIAFVFASRSRGALLLGLAGLTMAMYAAENIDFVADRLSQQDVSSGRYLLWLVLLPQTADEFLFGRGTGFMWQLTSFDVNRWGGYVSDANASIYAHNDFLFWLVELGVFGVFAWAVFCFSFLLHSVRFTTGVGANRKMRAAGFVGVATALIFLVSQSVDTVLFGSMAIFKILPVIAVSVSLRHRHKLNTIDQGWATSQGGLS